MEAQNLKIVIDFIDLFKNLNNREPLESEIIDNLKDKISSEIIRSVLNKNNLITLKNISFDNVELDFV